MLILDCWCWCFHSTDTIVETDNTYLQTVRKWRRGSSCRRGETQGGGEGDRGTHAMSKVLEGGCVRDLADRMILSFQWRPLSPLFTSQVWTEVVVVEKKGERKE